MNNNDRKDPKENADLANSSDRTDSMMRLSKLMAERGLCSRREADQYIEQGLVYVDGSRINQLGTKVHPDCHIELAAKAKEKQDSLVTIILNKPVGYVSSQPEDSYEPAIRLIIAENQFTLPSQKKIKSLERQHFRGLAVAGRLDIDSQGLLLFTQDGRLAKKIIGENSAIEKEYLVRFKGELTSEKLKLLRSGLELDGKPLKRAKVDQINPDQLRFVLNEGKKRQIRRMMELVQLQVTGLKRVRIGQLRLGKLPEGQWRFLSYDEEI